ncbi:Cocaine esterase [Cytospora mali]|uniref:Cocaine esterase n=1 Tax=Cytospora mali TaxID=578113 RepID=A0A194VNS0_CYTMA|nr:Cocaine esterase [Valsa mali]
MNDKPVPRGYGGALLDRFMAWSNGLPPETCNYTVTPVKIPLEGEEDVELLADLYQPVTKDNEPAAGTILVQCIYGRNLLLALTLRPFPSRGYNVLLVSTRGTFGSGGKSDPARTDRADGPRVIGIKKSVPLLDAAKAQLGDKASWLYEWMTRPGWDTDDFYEPMKQYKALETTKAAILLPTGWQDLFINDTLGQYQRLSERGCTVAMTVGPWNHLQAGGGTGVMKETLDWLDKYLAKRTAGDIRPAPVRINVTGANEWRWLPSWPPATKPLELYLDSQGRLGRKEPEKTDESSFTFDPHDPTPTLGGNLLFGGGVANDTALAKRSDVLTFTTAPLDHDIEFLGKPRIELTHSSKNSHVDLFVRLSEVNAKGVSHNITEVYKRLDPNRAPAGQPVKIELNMTDSAHRFKEGTAIRVIVAGANFPHYSYNLGSGESQATGTTLKPATHTVHLGINSGSRLVLPVSLE